MTNQTVQFLARPDGTSLAYQWQEGKGVNAPCVVFLCGFMSDMGGTKAAHLADWAAQRGHAFLRFDYFGHGQSSGPFTNGTISRWKDDAMAMLDEVAPDRPLVLIGSSMGGWIMLLAALARPERVQAMVGIAPAPDFTEKLMWAGMSPQDQKTIMEEGALIQPSDYDEPYTITKALIEDGRTNQILDAPIALTCPVRILQGQQDADVPWQHALKTAEALASDDVVVTLVKNGDHRLSEPADLKRLEQTLDDLIAEAC
ncbi:MAG: alpha/beta hydrolase [Alphaproteobacteria bacterium]